MHRCYTEILEKMGEPLWWDDQAVPRYVPFHPNECGVYDDYVALLEIACQACGERFLVASAWSKSDIWRFNFEKWCADRNGKEYENKPLLPDRDGPGSFNWGDPPNKGCCPSGPTMSSDLKGVKEFWFRPGVVDGKYVFGWIRLHEHEFTYEEEPF